MRLIPHIFLALLLGFSAAGQDLASALDEAIRKEAAALVPGYLKLPAVPPLPQPPPAVQAAGEPFIHAWRSYQSIRIQPPAEMPAARLTTVQGPINAATWQVKFNDLHPRHHPAEHPPLCNIPST
jgi:hypothetical protein